MVFNRLKERLMGEKKKKQPKIPAKVMKEAKSITSLINKNKPNLADNVVPILVREKIKAPYGEKINKEFYKAYASFQFIPINNKQVRYFSAILKDTPNISNIKKQAQKRINILNQFNNFIHSGSPPDVDKSDKPNHCFFALASNTNITPVLFSPKHLFDFVENMVKAYLKVKLNKKYIPLNLKKLDIMLINRKLILVGFGSRKYTMDNYLEKTIKMLGTSNFEFGPHSATLTRTGKLKIN
ncbi:hypothetical protein HN777_04720 [Candidatus Woesearchaeota archaeon]|jgi:hypothetical protein|nr:hypothetical protein [Candidatus Woesearchaeota archaeon]MBT7403064.1 hypothetical protein [Candidatus Woesearchaeota archaeon]